LIAGRIIQLFRILTRPQGAEIIRLASDIAGKKISALKALKNRFPKRHKKSAIAGASFAGVLAGYRYKSAA
jgi:hypothetical protein